MFKPLQRLTNLTIEPKKECNCFLLFERTFRSTHAERFWDFMYEHLLGAKGIRIWYNWL